MLRSRMGEFQKQLAAFGSPRDGILDPAACSELYRRLVPNPISAMSLWKIIDNLRPSLIEPALVALLAGGWQLLPGAPVYWTAVAVAVLFWPAYYDLLFAILRVPFRDPHVLAT